MQEDGASHVLYITFQELDVTKEKHFSLQVLAGLHKLTGNRRTSACQMADICIGHLLIFYLIKDNIPLYRPGLRFLALHHFVQPDPAYCQCGLALNRSSNIVDRIGNRKRILCSPF